MLQGTKRKQEYGTTSNSKSQKVEASLDAKSKSKKYCVFGLGNPGPKYVGTRHNIGADCIQALFRKYSISQSSLR
jgi:hypothetical protein